MIAKGDKISDRYQIIKNIGEGGMANVFLAYDTILEREVAVKVLRGDLATDEKFVRRFQREALSASSLSNPNIVEVYDVGEDNGEYYIVMEYVEGKHLKHLIKKRGTLTPTEVVDIALQMTNGLSVAHESYIIHRDIKPQNILIIDNGIVKITDFGIAVAMNATQLTQTNSVMGSVHYLPPEQAMGKSATLQSDIYSIGILLYELATGKLPYTGENAVEIALKHLKENIPDVQQEASNIPNSLANIIRKATAKNPKNRYNDAGEMYEDLKTCLSDDRKEEDTIKFKYPEIDYDETKALKIIKPEKDNKKKQKALKDDEIIAKKITKKDLNKEQNKMLILLGVIFTSLVVIITTVVLLIPKITASTQVIIPDVSGLSSEKAIVKLQDKGFVVSDTIIEESSSKYEEGIVIKTNPLSGTKRKKGFEVKLYISTGSSELVVEDYSGENYALIKGKLEALGMQVLIEKLEVDITEAKYEENIIIDQSVEPGETLTEGDIITLYIPKLDNKYPDFYEEGYTLDEVKIWAEEMGLNFSFTNKVTQTETPGTILSQSRPAGTTVISGATLRVEVAVVDTNDPEEEIDDCDGLC
jgi:serine/threonine-protein kinase